MTHHALLRTTLIALLTSCATYAMAAPVRAENCWIRAMPASVPSSAYFTLQNDNDAAVSLTGVSTPAFGMAMLHRTISEGDTSKMIHIDSADIAAHGTLVFAPKGYHVMLEEPKQPLKIGSQLPMTFRFADGTETQANCEVKPASFAGK